MMAGIHSSWQPQGRTWSQFLSCGILHRTRQTCVCINKSLEDRHSVCHVPRSWWLFSFAQSRGISKALLLARNGDCAGRGGGESYLVTLFLSIYKYSLTKAGLSYKMAIHVSLPPAFPSLLMSLPAQQIPIINPSLWKPGVIQIHLLQHLIYPLLQDTGFRVFYELHFTALYHTRHSAALYELHFIKFYQILCRMF